MDVLKPMLCRLCTYEHSNMHRLLPGKLSCLPTLPASQPRPTQEKCMQTTTAEQCQGYGRTETS